MRKIILFITLFFLCFQLSAFCQSSNGGLTNTLLKLKALSNTRPAEKVYLHFDKPYYAAGDTLYFKAYVTLSDRHWLSGLSGILHVDLINPDNTLYQSIKLPLNNGTAWGDFALPDSLPKGNYRVRAYTWWMLNEGENYFFDRTIPIGSVKNYAVKKPALPQTTARKSYIAFFPEGGELLTGVRSKIAFKATDTAGLGVKINGVIVDNSGRVVSRFEPTHLGMGYFYLRPEDGKTYQAKVIFPDGTKSLIDIQKASIKGITLAVNNDTAGTAAIKIICNDAYFAENHGKEFSLIIYSAGVPLTVKCKLDGPEVKLEIKKQQFRSGVMQLTLFSDKGEPLNERLLFIQNADQLKLNLVSDKQVYDKRGLVNFSLSAKDGSDNPVQGNLSIAVIDESKVPVNESAEHTILTDLLLTSDVKGYVEQPNYYFTNITGETRANLDILMLTQGYRRFTWKQLMDDQIPSVRFRPEKYLEIAGLVKTPSGKLVTNGNVSLFDPTGEGPELKTTTDTAGKFIFKNLVFTDTTKFDIRAETDPAQITLFSTRLIPPLLQQDIPGVLVDVNNIMKGYLENKSHELPRIKPRLAKGIVLKEVYIKAKKLDNTYRTQSLAGAGNADQVVHFNEMPGGGLLADQLNGRLRGVLFVNGVAYLKVGNTGPMLIIVDGIEMVPFRIPGRPYGYNINDLNFNDVATVEVLKSANMSIYGVFGGNGVMIITTKQGGEGNPVEEESTTNALHIAPGGFYKAREFYSPQYTTPALSNKTDLRTTVFWKPDLVTDKEGNAKFNFFNADGSGSYRVVMEGIDNKGNVGRQVYRYQVTDK